MNEQVFNCCVYMNTDKINKHLIKLQNKHGQNIPISEAMKFELELKYLPCDTK